MARHSSPSNRSTQGPATGDVEPSTFSLHDRAQWLPQAYDELTSTAIHEAGHAVMAYRLNHPFIAVTVIPDEASLGSVRNAPSSSFGPNQKYDLRTRTHAEEEVMISLAGAETQRQWLRWALPPQTGIDEIVATHSAHDRRMSEEIAQWIAGSASIKTQIHEGLHQRVLLELAASRDLLDIASSNLDNQPELVPKRCLIWVMIFALARELACTGTVSWSQARAMLEPISTAGAGYIPEPDRWPGSQI